MKPRQYVNPSPSKPKSTDEQHEAVSTLRVVGTDGRLWVSGLPYQSPELHALQVRMSGSARVTVIADAGCREFLYVLDPFLSIYLKVPRFDTGQRGVDLIDHRQTLRLERCRGLSGERRKAQAAASKMLTTRHKYSRKDYSHGQEN